MNEEPNLDLLYRQGSRLTTIHNPAPGAYGKPPAVVLINPKYPHNVGAVVRACSCYGVSQLWYTGNRVRLEGGDMQKVRGASCLTKGPKFRLPREERMKDYADVSLFQNDRPFDQFGPDVIPVAVEVRDTSEPLPLFDHPEKAVYVFGPEDGSISKSILPLCHRFVVIPTRTRMPLNLAAAVYTVLYDRSMKERNNGHV